jgi:hypothetical protein
MRRIQRSPFLKLGLAALLVTLGLASLQQTEFLSGDPASHAAGKYGYGYSYSYREAATDITTGAGRGGGPHVRVFFANSPYAEQFGFMAYSQQFGGGVSVARADIDQDGFDDIITGAGPGGGPHVRVFDDTGADTGFGFMAYNPAFSGGVEVAAADVTGDGKAEIITAPGPGGGPHVRIWKVNNNGTVTELAGFMAYDPNFTGGVHIAAGDIDGNDDVEIITGAGPGGGPHVRAFSHTGAPTNVSFMAYSQSFSGGVYVARGDVDGQGVDEIITGAGAGGGPHVRTFKVNGSTGAATEYSGFMAYPTGFSGGVRVASGDVATNGSSSEVITGAGPGGWPHVRVFLGTGTPLNDGFVAYTTAFKGGVYVAGGDS